MYPWRWRWKLCSREAVPVKLMLLFCWVPHRTVLEVSATRKSQTQECLWADLRIYPEAGTRWDPAKDPVNGHLGGGSCRACEQQRPQTHKITSQSSCSGKAPIGAFLLCSHTDEVELPQSLLELCVDLSTQRSHSSVYDTQASLWLMKTEALYIWVCFLPTKLDYISTFLNWMRILYFLSL